jgi:hypothetical protein
MRGPALRWRQAVAGPPIGRILDNSERVYRELLI